MKLPTEVFGDVVVVHTPEELNADQADAVRSFITGLEQNQVVLDVDNTETLDSAGLAVLLDSQDLLREEAGDLKIATTGAVNRKIFEITRIDEELEVFESVLEAVKSFS